MNKFIVRDNDYPSDDDDYIDESSSDEEEYSDEDSGSESDDDVFAKVREIRRGNSVSHSVKLGNNKHSIEIPISPAQSKSLMRSMKPEPRRSARTKVDRNLVKYENTMIALLNNIGRGNTELVRKIKNLEFRTKPTISKTSTYIKSKCDACGQSRALCYNVEVDGVKYRVGPTCGYRLQTLFDVAYLIQFAKETGNYDASLGMAIQEAQDRNEDYTRQYC